MIRRAAVLVSFAALACAAAPGATRVPTIAPGVIVGGVYVGDLTSEPARAELAAAFDRPVVVVHGDMRWWAWPQSLGAGAAVNSAVEKALTAAPGEEISVDVRWSSNAVDRLAATIARGVAMPPVDAQLVRVTSTGPVIQDAKPGVTINPVAFRRDLEGALREGLRAPLDVPTRPLQPARTRAAFGPLIWINRGSNTLRLYNGLRFVRTFRVATGQAVYPTPAGLWQIVTKQRDPWWLPPDSPWARGSSPIPPGPGNPLGTRWMGLSAAGVGIHGTPNAASIGYSVSHGCIRMHIPDAEWLFTHVRVGTPVYIS